MPRSRPAHRQRWRALIGLESCENGPFCASEGVLGKEVCPSGREAVQGSYRPNKKAPMVRGLIDPYGGLNQLSASASSLAATVRGGDWFVADVMPILHPGWSRGMLLDSLHRC